MFFKSNNFKIIFLSVQAFSYISFYKQPANKNLYLNFIKYSLNLNSLFIAFFYQNIIVMAALACFTFYYIFLIMLNLLFFCCFFFLKNNLIFRLQIKTFLFNNILSLIIKKFCLIINNKLFPIFFIYQNFFLIISLLNYFQISLNQFIIAGHATIPKHFPILQFYGDSRVFIFIKKYCNIFPLNALQQF